MQVSFIIPLFNCLPLTQAMLASLQATLPAGLTHEIIFVDDGSTDGTRDWLKTLNAPAFRVVINERNLGYAAANNRGATLARAELLVLLNNDLVLTPRWLEPLLRAHARLGACAGAIGNVQLDARTGVIDHAGIVINRCGKPEHARALPPFWSRLLRSTHRVPAVTGACLLIERALWRQLNGFDEGFVNGGEDVDLCYRVRAAGRINVVSLDSVIRHHVSSSAGRKLRDEQNSHRLMRRWHREFLVTAPEATRSWSRDHLAEILPRIHWRQTPLACHALLHAARAMPTPPPQAIADLESAQEREFARWIELFGA